MTDIAKSGAVLFAKDPQRVAAFYEALAGLQVTHSGKDCIVLESVGSQLMVHPIAPKIARTIPIKVPAQRRSQAVVKLVFAVASIAQARARAPALGGGLDPPERMFDARGFRACDGHDPEGNVIQFREDVSVPAQPLKRKSARKAGVDYATVRELALALADVVDSSTLRGIAYKARGKLLACKAIHRSAEPETLVVRVGAAARDRLLEAEPDSYYLTAHYLAHESVLVRMASIDRKGLQELLQLAWNFVTAASQGVRRPSKRKKATSVFRYL
jgi:predicted enzyme related to lactoylglutathione lyase